MRMANAAIFDFIALEQTGLLTLQMSIERFDNFV